MKLRGPTKIKLKSLDEHDIKRFNHAMKKEWETNLKIEAVRLLSFEEARLVRQRIGHRIMRSRYVHTFKPFDLEEDIAKELILRATLNGETCKAKSRSVCRGDNDPDVLRVESTSPVISRDCFMFALQLIASHQWRLHFADFSQASMP